MAQNIPLRDKHPYLVNLALIACAAVVALFVALLFIDVFTSHGQEKLVPEVRNMSLDQAIDKLEDAGLNWEIADSSNFNDTFAPGAITDQEPKAGSYIKAIRPVYLYVNAMHQREVSFPKVTDQSLSIARTTLHDMGFRIIEVDTVPSREAIVLAVLVNGRQVAPGTPVPINARIRLSVGDGSLQDYMPSDQLSADEMDSIEDAQALQQVQQYIED